MAVSKGEKVHVVIRRLFDDAVRRHFAGEIKEAEGPVVRLEGYAFIYEEVTIQYVRKPGRRTTIIDLSESGYIANIIPADVDIDALSYQYVTGGNLVVTDGKNFSLDINEFGAKH